MYTFTKPTLCVRDIGLIKQITVKDFDHFTDHLSPISREVESFMGGNLFALKGQEWREMRMTLSPTFTGSKMRGMFHLMAECAENFAKHFAENTKDEVTEIELKGIFTKYANDVIASAAFGIKCNSLEDENNAFYKMGNRITVLGIWTFVKFGLYAAAPGLMNFFRIRVFPKEPVEYFHKIVMETVKTREEQNIYRPDMIQLLMEARKGHLKHENKNDSGAGFATVEEFLVNKTEKYKILQLSDDDITAQALIFFLAGFDATSITMSFLMMELALNPEIQKRLHQEVDKTMAACNGKLTYDVVVKMTYLDQVVSGIKSSS